MNVLVDAHLPRRLVWRLREAGHDAIHTPDLPDGNRSTDSEINAVSLRQERIVVTKYESTAKRLNHKGHEAHEG